MSLPDLMTETDFLVREFPTPGNPMRPLAIVVPGPDGDASGVAQSVAEHARLGYGGLVLDPVGFDGQFLTGTWFDTVGRYIEACRLAGLFLWLLDGMTIGAPLAAILDRITPDWRGPMIGTRSFAVEGTARVDLVLEGPPESRLLGLLARAAAPGEPPINLLPRLDNLRLQWDPPPGQWEVIAFWAHRPTGGPDVFPDWTHGPTVASWLRAVLCPLHERFATHLGRTVQGIVACCPSWPRLKAHGDELMLPLLAGEDPSWLDLAGLASPVAAANRTRSYAGLLAEAVRQSYLTPLRDWCWHHRLRVAAYRLGGLPLLGLTGEFDLGGLPDLMPAARTDPAELAALAGVARYYRQERVAAQLMLTGEVDYDRAQVGRLAVAGADLFLVRRSAGYAPDCESALTDYAARIVMAVSAGGPAEEFPLVAEAEPNAVHDLGRKVLDLATRGFDAVCLPAAEAVSIGEAEGARADLVLSGPDAPPASEQAAQGMGMRVPPGLAVRGRKVEGWNVYTFLNHAEDKWRGPVDLPAFGAVEVWRPATGEQRPVAAMSADPGLRVPLALEPGEAALVVAKRPGMPHFRASSQLVAAHLTLARSWRFEAVGGNVLPLSWRERVPGSWVADFAVLAALDDLQLVGIPSGCAVWLNDGLLIAGSPAAPLTGRVRTGVNQLEIKGTRQTPAAQLRGGFVSRGQAIDHASGELAGPWTLNGYPYFTGPGVYRQSFAVSPALIRAELTAWLEVSALADSAAVRLNGLYLGYLPWPPFRLEIGAADVFGADDNLLELEVHVPPGKSAWAFKGLLGEVSILLGEVARDERTAWPPLGNDGTGTGAKRS